MSELVAKTVTETVPGLVPAPEKGKFLVRKNKDENVSEPYVVVLRVTDEEDYTWPAGSVDDGTLINSAYQLLAVRRGALRQSMGP